MKFMKSLIKYEHKCLAVLSLVVLVAALVSSYRPEKHLRTGTINLATIPTVIGEWRMVSQDTTLGSKEEMFLDDVLVRAYQRLDGKTVILAIAYGADQRKNFSIHLPEVCYKAAGYDVTTMGQSTISSLDLKLRQMLAKKPDGSLESIQYWIVLNGHKVTSEFEKRLRHFYYSFFGAKDGGVLVRVSSLTAENELQNDFGVQDEFISTFHRTLNSELRIQLFGKVRE
jgi:EpsI family protein